jgi:hypothetical protein
VIIHQGIPAAFNGKETHKRFQPILEPLPPVFTPWPAKEGPAHASARMCPADPSRPLFALASRAQVPGRPPPDRRQSYRAEVPRRRHFTNCAHYLREIGWPTTRRLNARELTDFVSAH